MQNKQIDEELIKRLQGSLDRYENVRVTFMTKKGTKRVMVCSRVNVPQEGADHFSLHHESIIAVYDLEYNAWRSFRKDSVISYDTFRGDE